MPCISVLFLLNFKDPHKTCNQESSRQQQHVPGLALEGHCLQGPLPSDFSSELMKAHLGSPTKFLWESKQPHLGPPVASSAASLYFSCFNKHTLEITRTLVVKPFLDEVQNPHIEADPTLGPNPIWWQHEKRPIRKEWSRGSEHVEAYR